MFIYLKVLTGEKMRDILILINMIGFISIRCKHETRDTRWNIECRMI